MPPCRNQLPLCATHCSALGGSLCQLAAGGRKDRDERREVRAELRRLGKEERQRQEKAVAEVLQGAQVICTTLTGGGRGGGGEGPGGWAVWWWRLMNPGRREALHGGFAWHMTHW